MLAAWARVRERGTAPKLVGESVAGRTCLVTGASSGLGRAVAIELGRRGARLLLACRSGIPEVGDEIRRLTGAAVEMLPLDLADLSSVRALAAALADRGARIDVVVLNAGMVASRSERTRDGFERMFQVNFLANVLLVDRLLAGGVIERSRPERPRIVVVASESHRDAEPLDAATLGAFVPFELADSLRFYGQTKLALCTFAHELSRRLQDERGVDVAVHALCPGAVATNIARDAPWYVRPLIGPALRLMFQSPEAAAGPVVWLASARALEGTTGRYLHMSRTCEASAAARDPARGAELWRASRELLALDPEPQGATRR